MFKGSVTLLQKRFFFVLNFAIQTDFFPPSGMGSVLASTEDMLTQNGTLNCFHDKGYKLS